MSDEPMPELLVRALAELSTEEWSRGRRLWNAVDEESRSALTAGATSPEGAKRLALMMARPVGPNPGGTFRSFRRKA